METMKKFSDQSPIVDKCFCCIGLRTAAKVLGIISIFCSFWPTILVFVIMLPGHICWFYGLFMGKPKLLLIGSAFHACTYALHVYVSVYFMLKLYGLFQAVLNGIFNFCLVMYFMIVEISFYKSMTASTTKPDNMSNA